MNTINIHETKLAFLYPLYDEGDFVNTDYNILVSEISKRFILTDEQRGAIRSYYEWINEIVLTD